MAQIQAKPLKYHTVYQAIYDGIHTGKYQSGAKLPTENDLIQHFGTSRATVIRALKELERNNLVRRRQGSGSFVMDQQKPLVLPLGMLNQLQPGDFADSIQEQLQRGLTESAQAAGCPLHVHSIKPGTDPVKAARVLIDRGIGGGFLVPLELPLAQSDHNEKIAEAFRAARIPIVILGKDVVSFPRRSGLDVVDSANRYGGYLQTQHLLSLGCRRVVFVGVSFHAPIVASRRDGYFDAMRSHSIEPQPQWLLELEDQSSITEGLIKSLMTKQRPDGIACKSDAFAALIMRQLLRLGYRVPQDVKLIGFDDRPIATLLPVALTTIRQPVKLWIDQAMHLLQSRMHDFNRPASSVELDVELVIRESTAG